MIGCVVTAGAVVIVRAVVVVVVVVGIARVSVGDAITFTTWPRENCDLFF